MSRIVLIFELPGTIIFYSSLAFFRIMVSGGGGRLIMSTSFNYFNRAKINKITRPVLEPILFMHFPILFVHMITFDATSCTTKNPFFISETSLGPVIPTTLVTFRDTLGTECEYIAIFRFIDYQCALDTKLSFAKTGSLLLITQLVLEFTLLFVI